MIQASKNFCATLSIIGSVFLIGCQEKDDIVPGTGEGKLGFAIVLGSSNNSQVNARTLTNHLEITEGFIQIKDLELEVEGRDDDGDFENELEIEFEDVRKVTFDQLDESSDFFISIPEGDYEEIDLELDLIDYRDEPSIYLDGQYQNQNGNNYQLIFEYFGDEIDFEVEIESEGDDAYFRIDNLINPLALLEINAYRWFGDISNIELDNADSDDGIIRINDNTNTEMYLKIINRIEASSEIEIELR